MNRTGDGYEGLVSRFVDWAEGEENVRAAIVVGSQARTDHPADQWADLDLIVIARDGRQLAADDLWITRIGTPVFSFLETTPSGEPERRVLFQGGAYGLDVDFAILSLDAVNALLDAPQVSSEMAAELFNVFGRGMHFVLDNDQLAQPVQALIASLHRPVTVPPSAAAFAANVSDFWYHALWSAKHLRRGEIWWAKAGCDMRLKHLLLTMLEWHACFAAEGQRDTWFRGRFLETWVDPRAREDLTAAFAHYDEADIWRALAATMQLFRWSAMETADCLHYPYPRGGDDYVTTLVTALAKSIAGDDA